MRRWLVASAFIAVVLALLVLEFRIIPGCSFGQQPAANGAHQNGDAYDCSELGVALFTLAWRSFLKGAIFLDDHINETIAVLTAAATAAIAAFTWTLRNATVKLWESAERQITKMDGHIVEAANAAKAMNALAITTAQAAERELRAYVFVENAWIVWNANEDGWNITYKMKNFGATPASDVVVADMTASVDSISDFTPSFDDKTMLGALAPHGDFVDMIAPSIGDASGDDVRSGKKSLMLAGRIDYKDTFGNKCYTTFCYVVAEEIPENGEMDIHEKWNDYR